MSGYDDRYDEAWDVPKPVDVINERVREKIKSRAELGAKKYGIPITRDDIDLEGWLKHLQEELMDAAVYVERIMHELRKTQDDHK